MDTKLKIVLTGGGSGGHVIPSLAMLPELKRTFDKIIYVGGAGIERTLAKKEGLGYFEINTAGFDRKHFFKNFKTPFLLIGAVKECKKYFRSLQPDVVFGKGGYIQLPAVIAARMLHIPVVCHESDLSLGLSNRIASKLGAVILTGFNKTATLNHNFVCTGFPLRRNLFSGNKTEIYEKYSLDTSKKVLLVMGGSLGATAINDILEKTLPTLLRSYNVLHITGKSKNKVKKTDGYYPIEYTDKINDFFAAADVVVSRAGAGAVSELSALNKAVVFIPLPKTSSRGDQLLNAEVAAEHGATVLLQENLTVDNFINAIYKCRRLMTPVAPRGNRKISDILTAFAEKHHSVHGCDKIA